MIVQFWFFLLSPRHWLFLWIEKSMVLIPTIGYPTHIETRTNCTMTVIRKSIWFCCTHIAGHFIKSVSSLPILHSHGHLNNKITAFTQGNRIENFGKSSEWRYDYFFIAETAKRHAWIHCVHTRFFHHLALRGIAWMDWSVFRVFFLFRLWSTSDELHRNRQHAESEPPIHSHLFHSDCRLFDWFSS